MISCTSVHSILHDKRCTELHNKLHLSAQCIMISAVVQSVPGTMISTPIGKLVLGQEIYISTGVQGNRILGKQ